MHTRVRNLFAHLVESQYLGLKFVPTMPANRNALLRYRTIDKCLSNHYRRWTLEDLIDACSDALYEYEGITRGVSRRTVQLDLQMMRSERLGYNAPIEVYEGKYYRYSDRDYSITRLPLSYEDVERMKESVQILNQFRDFDCFVGMSESVMRLQEYLTMREASPRLIVDFERNDQLRGLQFLSPLYDLITMRTCVRVVYHSFRSRQETTFLVSPLLLKSYRNRWFVFAHDHGRGIIINLPLDRIVSLEPDEGEVYRSTPEFDPATYFDDVIGVTKHGRLQRGKVTIWVSPDHRGYVETKPLHSSQRTTATNEDGSIVIEIDVVFNPELYAVLLSLSPGICVVSPGAVRRRMRSYLRRALDLYI